MKRITIIVFGLLIISISKGQNYNETELDSVVEITYNYFRQGKCEKAIPLLKETLKKCSGSSEIHRITTLMMDCYFATSQYDKMFDILNYGNSKGVVYRFPSFYMDSLSDSPKFKEILHKNDSVLLIEKANAKATVEIVLPDNYDKKKQYPLFIVLTKGSRTKKTLIDSYRSNSIKEEFIMAFMHSSDFRGTNFYQWHNEKERRPEIENMYNEVKNKYSIDTTKIIIGGMSNCGQMAIDMTFRGSFPIIGFIAFCPTDAKITDIEILHKNGSKIKGAIVAGKSDRRFLKEAETMRDIMIKNNFQLIYEAGNFGHQIPKNSYLYIDKAISYFFND